ncbi:dihydroorotase, partial [Staphylococcus aureus]
WGKAKGLNITAEVAPHHFILTDEAVMDYRTFSKMNPPLRAEADRLALIEGLADGTIDAIATDHAPHDTESKRVPMDVASFGIVGLETMLPLS